MQKEKSCKHVNEGTLKVLGEQILSLRGGVVLGKHYPDLYAAPPTESQKELSVKAKYNEKQIKNISKYCKCLKLKFWITYAHFIVI